MFLCGWKLKKNYTQRVKNYKIPFQIEAGFFIRTKLRTHNRELRTLNLPQNDFLQNLALDFIIDHFDDFVFTIAQFFSQNCGGQFYI